MRYRIIIDEDFNHYKKPSMIIGCIKCSGKCCIESNISKDVCINNHLYNEIIKTDDNKDIINRYLDNIITSAIVFAGLEPFDQFDEIIDFIKEFRKVCNDDIVIYSGYNEDEINIELDLLKKYKNIYIKIGRYIPNNKYHIDEVLGIKLVSDNQYVIKVS